MMLKRKRSHGFTLVELLVVIGIIALLISILFPALRKVQQAARGIRCLANLRNLSNNLALYASQNRGQIVLGYAGLFSINGKSREENNGHLLNLFDPTLAACPEMVVRNAAGSTLVGYGWNRWLGFIPQTSTDSSYPLVSKRILPSRCKNPAETACFGDIVAFGGGSAGGLSDPCNISKSHPTFTLYAPQFAGRHNGMGSVLWMDGHASLERPILPPDDLSLYAYTPSESLAYYRKNNYGYLARSASELTTIGGLYYYVFDKGPLGQSDPSPYYDAKKLLW